MSQSDSHLMRQPSVRAQLGFNELDRDKTQDTALSLTISNVKNKWFQ